MAMIKYGVSFTILVGLILLEPLIGESQQRSKYGARVLSVEAYRQLDDKYKLVRVDDLVPGIFLDVRYASDCNFMGKKMYPSPAAYLVKPAAEAIKLVEDSLRKIGLALVFYDGYRPYSVTVEFWKQATRKEYVAHPRQGSRHNRGCAVDVGLVRYCDKSLLEMPTPYDDFTSRAHAFDRRATPEAVKNRRLLQSLMVKYGFRIFTTEWWHFDYKDWKSYPLLDIPFEEL
jgi:D-alanyl-D-alanine dipeptidase